MLNIKDLVALTEHQLVGQRLIKVENWDNKNYKRHAQPNLILLFNEKCSFTSNFDFELPLSGSIKTRQWQQRPKKATLKYFIILKKETVENAMTFDKGGHILM